MEAKQLLCKVLMQALPVSLLTTLRLGLEHMVRLYNGAFLGTYVFPRQFLADPAMPRLLQMRSLESMTGKHCAYITRH